MNKKRLMIFGLHCFVYCSVHIGCSETAGKQPLDHVDYITDNAPGLHQISASVLDDDFDELDSLMEQAREAGIVIPGPKPVSKLEILARKFGGSLLMWYIATTQTLQSWWAVLWEKESECPCAFGSESESS